jgi:hypothetical protein
MWIQLMRGVDRNTGEELEARIDHAILYVSSIRMHSRVRGKAWKAFA